MHASTQGRLGFSLGDLSYINSDFGSDTAPQHIPQNIHHGVLHWVHDLVHWMAVRQHRRVVMQELAMMSDRELSDIGLSRADVPHIFAPEFRGKADYIAY